MSACIFSPQHSQTSWSVWSTKVLPNHHDVLSGVEFLTAKLGGSIWSRNMGTKIASIWIFTKDNLVTMTLAELSNFLKMRNHKWPSYSGNDPWDSELSGAPSCCSSLNCILKTWCKTSSQKYIRVHEFCGQDTCTFRIFKVKKSKSWWKFIHLQGFSPELSRSVIGLLVNRNKVNLTNIGSKWKRGCQTAKFGRVIETLLFPCQLPDYLTY